jgi:hypothetical protein
VIVKRRQAGVMMRTTATWLLRVLWFLLPLTAGRAVDNALDGASDSVALTMVIGLWALWAVGLAATAIALPLSLTTVRILSPMVVALVIWALVIDGTTATSLLALAHGAALLGVSMNHLIGDRFADGASYGDERRMPLRAPAQLLATAVPLAWTLIAAGLASGPLLLADRRWILGTVATVAGIIAVPIGGRALHQLSRRWIVFVPTGFVLHDYVALTEPVLFRRSAVERLGPAIAGSPARDLTNGAAGLLLECELTDPAPLGLRHSSADNGTVATLTDVRRFLFAPSRPGALLDEAERRGLPVG